jgi:hypothetical protein
MQALAGGLPVVFEDGSDAVSFNNTGFGSGGNGFAGAAWFDYNNDGHLDLYLTGGCNSDNGLFRNNGDGTFSDVTQDAGVAYGGGSVGVVAGDFDNDGYQDILVIADGGFRGNCPRDDKVFHNLGDGTFLDITLSSGVVGPDNRSALSAALADINNDGFLDIFISGAGNELGSIRPRNKLYLNNGDLTFTDISAGSGVDTDKGACEALFTDYDDDGLIDLYVANCVRFATGGPVELFRNNGDLTFTDIAMTAGIHFAGYWMALAPGDFDNDEDIDFFMTNLGVSFPPQFHRLYRKNANGTYTSMQSSGVTHHEWGWGGSMSDFDNDGLLDIFFAGSFPPGFIGPGGGNPGTLLFNDGDSTFTETPAALPVSLASLYTTGVAVGDYDLDGFTDIVVAVDSNGGAEGHPVLFRNTGNENHWLTIRLRGLTGNRDAVGARVKVRVGDNTYTREVYAGSSFLSMDSQWLAFGLGDSVSFDQIEVRWPMGGTETFGPGSTNRVLTIIEGASVAGDADGDGNVDLDDVSGFFECVAAPDVTVPPCPAFDLDLDGDVDFADFAGVQIRFTQP